MMNERDDIAYPSSSSLLDGELVFTVLCNNDDAADGVTDAIVALALIIFDPRRSSGDDADDGIILARLTTPLLVEPLDDANVLPVVAPVLVPLGPGIDANRLVVGRLDACTAGGATQLEASMNKVVNTSQIGWHQYRWQERR
jgi:hypothetical protein